MRICAPGCLLLKYPPQNFQFWRAPPSKKKIQKRESFIRKLTNLNPITMESHTLSAYKLKLQELYDTFVSNTWSITYSACICADWTIIGPRKVYHGYAKLPNGNTIKIDNAQSYDEVFTKLQHLYNQDYLRFKNKYNN